MYIHIDNWIHIFILGRGGGQRTVLTTAHESPSGAAGGLSASVVSISIQLVG